MRGEFMREIIGWGSAFILIPTFGLQAYKQWRNRDEHADASTLWFFILALVGVVGQVVYSWMLGNWVYFVLNACLVVTNTLGLALAIHRRGVTGLHPSPDGFQDGQVLAGNRGGRRLP
jgi:hypothetical protein